MSATDPACPPRDRIELLLAEGLPEEEYDEVSSHVESCSFCLSVLDELTAADSIEHHLRGPLEAAERDCLTGWRGLTGRPADESARYRFRREHERGGMGRVSVAFDVQLHREVAFKEVKDRFSAGALARLKREAMITGKLEHPGVVPVYSLGQTAKGGTFYAMRLVRGESLDEAIRRLHRTHGPAAAAGPAVDKPRVTTQALLRRFLDVCNTVAYAHGRGAVHRDLKPANIMIGPYGETLVVDWGLAKVEGMREVEPEDAHTPPTPGDDSIVVTLPGVGFGTPGFRSPEQARGELARIGPASDIYSLGATLHMILTGRPPADPAGAGDAGGPTHQLDSGIDRDLTAICLKCLEEDPARRYPGAKSLADDLGRFLDSRPVDARPAGAVYKIKMFARRNRPLVAAAAAIGVGLLASVVALGWGLVQREARRVENEQAALRRLIDTHIDAARLALQRGAWAEALDEFAAARAVGRPEDAQTRLDRVKALDGLNRVTEAIRELDTLASLIRDGRLPATPAELALTRLREADLLSGRGAAEQARSRDLLRAVADAPLPEAERAYARGLVAPTAKEAETQFLEAVRLDPYHHRARLTLAMTLMVSGQAEAARRELDFAGEVYRDDPNVRLLRVAHHALLGEFAAAHAELGRAGRVLSPAMAEAVRTVIDALESSSARVGDAAWDDTEPLVQSVSALVPALLALGIKQDARSLAVLSTPPEFFRVYVRSIGSALIYQAPALRSLWGPVLGEIPRNDQELEQALDRACEANPEGLILMLCGKWLFASGRDGEAEARLREALAHDSAFAPAAVRLQCHELLINAEAALFLRLGVTSWNPNPPAGPDGQPLDKVAVEALRTRTRDHLQTYVKLGPPRRLLVNVAVALAWIVGERDQALFLARKGIEQWPNDGTLQKRVAMMEEKLGYRAPGPRVGGE